MGQRQKKKQQKKAAIIEGAIKVGAPSNEGDVRDLQRIV